MKIRDLMVKTTFKKVWKELRKLHNAKKSKLGYMNVWVELLNIKRIPKSDGTLIEVYKGTDSYDKKEYYAVHGLKDNQQWALEYSTFPTWLSWDITKETLSNHTVEFVLAHILWEMTWNGYSNKSIWKAKRHMRILLKSIPKEVQDEV